MKELSLNIGNYKKEERYDAKVMAALHIMNILLSTPGRGHPNFPDLGVGIEDFEFMRNSPQQIGMLQQKISTEISRILPDLDVGDITCTLESNRLSPILKIVINIGLPDSVDLENRKVLLSYEFTKENNRLVPKIYI
jgi:hypothetical protein